MRFSKDPNKMIQDAVTAPGHYRSHPSGIEVIEITRHMSFNTGNAIKYIMRCDHKGKPIQDRKKAIWYMLDSLGMMPDVDPEVIDMMKANLEEIRDEG